MWRRGRKTGMEDSMVWSESDWLFEMRKYPLAKCFLHVEDDGLGRRLRDTCTSQPEKNFLYKIFISCSGSVGVEELEYRRQRRIHWPR